MPRDLREPRRHTAAVTTVRSRLQTAAWVVYDLANTVYAAAVTFLFTPHARVVLGDQIGAVGRTNLLSMLLAAVLVPFAGAIADRTGRAHRYLAAATVLCVLATAAMAVPAGPWWLLACFFCANVAYNLGLLFYNALLPTVAAPDRTGAVSGLGVGVGYLGTILVLVVLLPLRDLGASRFALAAAMFLLLAAPCMLLVGGPPPAARSAGASETARAAARSLLATLRSLPQQRHLLLFLVANFCLVDVLNTAILFFADFTQTTFAVASERGDLQLLGWRFVGTAGLDRFLQVMGLLLNLAALAFGVALGRWTDLHPLGVLRGAAVALLVALLGGAACAGSSALGYALTLVLGGAFGLAGIWTAGRKVLLALAPPDRVGEYFGLYGITVKLSVLGAVVFAEVDDRIGPRAAMLAQGIQLLIGLACLCIVRIPPPAADVRTAPKPPLDPPAA